EPGVLARGDRQIRHNVQRMPAPRSPTVDNRDDDLGARAHEPLHLEDVEAPGPRRVDARSRFFARFARVAVAIAPSNALVPTVTKCPTAIFGAGAISRQNDRTDIGSHAGV